MGYDPDMNGAPLVAFDTRTAMKVPAEKSRFLRTWLTWQHVLYPITAGMGIMNWMWFQHQQFSIERGHWRDLAIVGAQRVLFLSLMPPEMTFLQAAGMHLLCTCQPCERSNPVQVPFMTSS